jgi:cytochrome c oxidase cbb3-type subunit 1
MESQATTYNYKVVRQFAVMTVIWGVVGMLVG